MRAILTEGRQSKLKVFFSYLLFSAVVLAGLSYFYQVPQNPPGFYLDESSISYNAYSISQSGRDEYGDSWPLYFRAFGEYKNPVYIYLLAILFRLFGPGILVARLFSATLGIATGILFWYLTFRQTRRPIVASTVALSALLTPWLFENSRVVFEVALYPVSLLLFLLAVYRASEKEVWGLWQPVSLALTLALLTYSYSIGRLFAPLLAIGLVILVSRSRFWGLLATWFIYALTLIPVFVFHLRHPDALMGRFWLLTYITPEKPISQLAAEFFHRYLINISPWRMFTTGEINIRDHVPNSPSLFLASFLIALAGLVIVLWRRRGDLFWRFMLYVLVICPIPASLTTAEFSQIRLTALPVVIHVFMIPGLMWLLYDSALPSASDSEPKRDGHRMGWRYAALGLLLLTLIVQGISFRLSFRQTSVYRWYIFDEQYPREVLPTALSQGKTPIYIHDPPGKSGYIQAYWHGLLRGLPATHFKRLSGDDLPPKDAVVISTAEQCSDCRMLLKSINYIVYIAGTGR